MVFWNNALSPLDSTHSAYQIAERLGHLFRQVDGLLVNWVLEAREISKPFAGTDAALPFERCLRVGGGSVGGLEGGSVAE